MLSIKTLKSIHEINLEIMTTLTLKINNNSI